MKVSKKVGVLIPLLSLLVFSIPTASANLNNSLGLLNSSASGKWSAQLATATGAPSSASYSITWTGSVNKQYELLSLVNVGSFDLLSGQITFTTAKANGDTTGIPMLTFDHCSGTWDATTFACSGVITSSGSATTGSINLNHVLQVGSRLVIRVTGTRNGSGNYISTLNAPVSRSQIRIGIVINS